MGNNPIALVTTHQLTRNGARYGKKYKEKLEDGARKLICRRSRALTMAFDAFFGLDIFVLMIASQGFENQALQS